MSSSGDCSSMQREGNPDISGLKKENPKKSPLAQHTQHGGFFLLREALNASKSKADFDCREDL